MASLYDSASLVMIPSGYKEDKVYSIKPTDGSGDLAFSRSNDTATRVNSSGLIEKVRTNLLTYSQDFTNAAWNKSNVSATGGQTDPNGGTTASLVQTTTASSAYFYQTQSGAKAFSIYAKAGTKSNFAIINGLYNQGAGFNLSTQTATSAGAGSLAKIEDVGGGWYRCSVYVSTSTEMIIMPADVSGGGMNVGDNLYFAFAQAETGDIATDYIATTSAAVSVGPVANLPRLDYSGGASCPKLLLEPQRTNLATFSEQINATNVTLNAATLTENYFVSPDGYTNADKLTETATASQHRFAKATSLGGSVDSSAYVISLFVKSAGRDKVQLYDNNQNNGGFTKFNLETKSVISGTGKIEDYGNGWLRLSIYPLKDNSTTSSFFFNMLNEVGDPFYTGDGTSATAVYGLQIEAGSYATSYIPTLSAASTRGVDTAITASIPSTIGQTEGTMYVEYTRNSLEERAFVILSRLTGTTGGSYFDSIYFYQLSNGNLVCDGFVSNSNQFTFVKNGGLSLGKHKMAIAYKQNDFALYIDGVQIGTDTSGNIPEMNFLTIGGGADVPNHRQSVHQTLLFKTRLTNAELAALTTI